MWKTNEQRSQSIHQASGTASRGGKSGQPAQTQNHAAIYNQNEYIQLFTNENMQFLCKRLDKGMPPSTRAPGSSPPSARALAAGLSNAFPCARGAFPTEGAMVYDNYHGNKYGVKESVAPEERARVMQFIESGRSHTPKPSCFRSESIKGKYAYQGPLLSDTDKQLLDELSEKERQQYLQMYTFPPTKYYPQVGEIRQDMDDDSLIFDSRFESGNLRRVYQISKNEYNLVLDFDSSVRHLHSARPPQPAHPPTEASAPRRSQRTRPRGLACADAN